MAAPRPEPPPPPKPSESMDYANPSSSSRRRSRSPAPLLFREDPLVKARRVLQNPNRINESSDDSATFTFGSAHSKADFDVKSAKTKTFKPFRSVPGKTSAPSNNGMHENTVPVASIPLNQEKSSPQVSLQNTQNQVHGAVSKDVPLCASQGAPVGDTNMVIDAEIQNDSPAISYAKIVSNSSKKKKLALEYYPPPPTVDNKRALVQLPIELCEKGSLPFANTLYGYFIGTKMAFPYMNDHLQKRWSKFGVGDISRNGLGFYFIKFTDEQGLNEVLEGGPWMINNVPFFVQRWWPGVNLSKENHDKVPVWVKIHNVPLEAWSVEGISRIASNIGKPLELDFYTEQMCTEGRGRSVMHVF